MSYFFLTPNGSIKHVGCDWYVEIFIFFAFWLFSCRFSNNSFPYHNHTIATEQMHMKTPSFNSYSKKMLSTINTKSFTSAASANPSPNPSPDTDQTESAPLCAPCPTFTNLPIITFDQSPPSTAVSSSSTNFDGSEWLNESYFDTDLCGLEWTTCSAPSPKDSGLDHQSQSAAATISPLHISTGGLGSNPIYSNQDACPNSASSTPTISDHKQFVFHPIPNISALPATTFAEAQPFSLQVPELYPTFYQPVYDQESGLNPYHLFHSSNVFEGFESGNSGTVPNNYPTHLMSPFHNNNFFQAQEQSILDLNLNAALAFPFQVNNFGSTVQFPPTAPPSPASTAPSTSGTSPAMSIASSPILATIIPSSISSFQNIGKPSKKKKAQKTSRDQDQVQTSAENQEAPRELTASEKKRIREMARNLTCFNCKTNKSPLWRRTPDKKHSLCNACGLFLKHYGVHRDVCNVSTKSAPSKVSKKQRKDDGKVVGSGPVDTPPPLPSLSAQVELSDFVKSNWLQLQNLLQRAQAAASHPQKPHLLD